MAYEIKNIYQGSYSSLDPNKNNLSPSDYPVTAGSLSLTTDPRNANQVKEISHKLSSGVKHIEMVAVSPEVFESIPNQQLEEVNRLAKLTGIDVTVHAPVVEPSGITNQGFNESHREAVERQMKMAIERAHVINPKGSSPVTFHSSAGLPGEIIEKDKKHPEEILVVNSESGSINRVNLKKSEFPGEPEISIENQLRKQNEEAWTQNISHINYYAEMGSDAINKYALLSEVSEKEKEAGKDWSEEEKQARIVYTRGVSYLDESYRNLKQLFDIAARKGSYEDKKLLNNFYDEITSDVEKIKSNPKSLQSIELKKNIVQKGTEVLNKMAEAPKIVESLNDFARDRTTDTFANVALHSYKEFRDTAPIISIENPPAGGAFSTGKELKQVVEESRDKFVKRAVAEGIMSEKEAKKEAEKLLGVTWDVGHINMMRKFGYDNKKLIEETEEIKPLLKHVHLSDNFGFEHTELPMGMGNVPVKEMMEKLGKEGFEAKKVIEAAQWWQHFQSPPVQATLEAFGSPIYSMQMSPYWNQSAGFEQGYYSGLGPVFPDINYQTFGGSFSQLPADLGGQRQGAAGSRMGGRGME